MNELEDLAAGRWAAFRGLEGCSVAEADAQLGPPVEPELHGGMFGGEPALFRRYPATPAAPVGITAWVLDDVVVGIEIRDACPDPASVSELGPPTLVLDSELGPSWSQEVWAGRGLVAHRRDDEVKVAFGLAPFEPEAWESDPLRWWRSERRTDPSA